MYLFVQAHLAPFDVFFLPPPVNNNNNTTAKYRKSRICEYKRGNGIGYNVFIRRYCCTVVGLAVPKLFKLYVSNSTPKTYADCKDFILKCIFRTNIN